ncbi:MAG: twitching motility protein PilT [Gemmatimonadetes bacterium]|nr:twitching motility protein PilT [Gemmatimonadota bacterium]
MILADTSVWVEHFRRGDRRLAAALEDERVLMHPFVLGELACGNLHNRSEVLHLLMQLPAAHIASDDEVLAFIERRGLASRGIGLVDAHLLASSVLTPFAQLVTLDRRLARIAAELCVA